MISPTPAKPGPLRTAALALLVLALLATPVSATWSILIIDTATGEVAIGIATCLAFFDLRPNTVVVVPGVGVGAAQSFVGPLSLRALIRNELLAGTTPAQIMALLATADPGHQNRQYGIVDVMGNAVTFTGSGAGAFASGLTGQTGSLVYAIQGNVLTGSPVILNAEQALITTAGDMGQKLMAAMEAARLMGGDGRCSCSPGNPTGCGSPPASFTKSSHIGLMIVSRPGDLDAPCNGALGCGAGGYYLDLNVANQPATALDPVLQLQALYNNWRNQHIGIADHFQSTVSLTTNALLANGNSVSTATVVLRDIQGTQLTAGMGLNVSLTSGSTATDVQIGPVTALGNGTYTFDVTSGFMSGQAVLDVVAGVGQAMTLLTPRPVLVVGGPFGPCGAGTVDDGLGGVVDLLQINGSSGNDRIVTLGINQSMTIQMGTLPLHPPGTGAVGNHMLWVRAGVPPLTENLLLGPGVGTLCFSPPPLPITTPTLLLADSFGAGGLISTSAAPWSITLSGLPVAVDFTLQGVVVDDLPFQLAVTNAVLLRVVLLPPPAITDVSPESAGTGVLVTINGTDFQPGAVLTVGGLPVTPMSVTNAAITFTMPSAVSCDATLTVTNVDNQSASTTINPTPVISNTLFPSGPAAGGASFLILGQNLATSTVTIGGLPATINSQGNSIITVTTPPGAVGSASVVVTSPAGCTVSTSYTYQ